MIKFTSIRLILAAAILFCVAIECSLGFSQTKHEDDYEIKWKSAKTYVEIVKIEERLFDRHSINELLTSRDKDLANRAFWSQTSAEIVAIKSKGNLNKFEYGLKWGEFYGYVAGATGLTAPDEWRHCLEYGRVPKSPGWGIEVLSSQESHQVIIGKEKYRVLVENSFGRDGSIVSLSDSGNENWKTSVISINDIDIANRQGSGGMMGESCYTCWFALLPGRNDSELVFWGFSNFGVCYYLIIDKQKGEITQRAYFPVLEPVYLRKKPK